MINENRNENVRRGKINTGDPTQNQKKKKTNKEGSTWCEWDESHTTTAKTHRNGNKYTPHKANVSIWMYNLSIE